MNLKKLILKASLGDKKSLDFIAEKYQNYVCFFCSTVISDSQKAENAFKKSFKAVFSAIEKNPKVDKPRRNCSIRNRKSLQRLYFR